MHSYRNALLTLVATALSVALVSCQPFFNQDGATILITVNGVLAPKAISPEGVAAPGEKLIVPYATTEVRVLATDPKGHVVGHANRVLAQGQNTISVGNLPIGMPLDIMVEALDVDGIAITSWQGRRILSMASTAISATLTPPAARLTTDLGSVAIPYKFATSLARGGVVFYRMAFPIAGERQILFDTRRAEYLWIGVYDSNWNPKPVVASDPAHGWAVIDVAAGEVVYAVAANAVKSPGYPSRLAQFDVIIRQAVFVDAGAAPSGTGTSKDPFNAIPTSIATNDRSYFIKDGLYTQSQIDIAGTASAFFYGGFSSTDWRIRAASKRKTEVMNSDTGAGAYTVCVAGSADCRFDGLYIKGQAMSNTVMTTVGLWLGSSTTCVVHDCALEGGSGTGLSSTVNSLAVNIALGDHEFSECAISGGAISTAGSIALLWGIYVQSGGTSNPAAYVHDCEISGGSASAASECKTVAVDIGGSTTNPSASGSAVIADCFIYGGNASATASNNSISRGVYHSFGAAAATSLDLASCVIGGGRASGSSAAMTYGVDLKCSGATSADILGCTIDCGGVAAGASYGICVNANSASAKVAGCLFTGASSIGTRLAVAHTSSATLGFLADNACIGIPSCLISTGTLVYDLDDDPFAATKRNNAGSLASSMSAEFDSYAAYSDLAGFLEGISWGVLGGSPLYLGSMTAENVAAFNMSLDPTKYPALLLDKRGTQRSASGAWSRGAYEF